MQVALNVRIEMRQAGRTFGAGLRTASAAEFDEGVAGFLEGLGSDAAGGDVLGLLVRRLDAAPGRADLPQAGEGRVRERRPVPSGDGGWFCLERVPCGRRACKKVPDLHGPYWYRYDLDAKRGRWRARYLGREDVFDPNDPDPVATIAQQTDGLFKLSGPTQADVERCKRGLRQVSVFGTEAADTLRVRLQSLYDTWMADHEHALREELAALRAKRARGDALSAEERDRLDSISEIVSAQH